MSEGGSFAPLSVHCKHSGDHLHTSRKQVSQCLVGLQSLQQQKFIVQPIHQSIANSGTAAVHLRSISLSFLLSFIPFRVNVSCIVTHSRCTSIHHIQTQYTLESVSREWRRQLLGRAERGIQWNTPAAAPLFYGCCSPPSHHTHHRNSEHTVQEAVPQLYQIPLHSSVRVRNYARGGWKGGCCNQLRGAFAMR